MMFFCFFGDDFLGCFFLGCIFSDDFFGMFFLG